MSKLCGKCSTEVSVDVGYTKCQGCNSRYHFSCSVSLTTWKAKSQELKDEWRCEACRRQAKQITKKTELSGKVDEVCGAGPGESTNNTLLLVQEYLKPLFEEHAKVTSSLISEAEKSLKNHVQAVNKNTEKLVSALCSKMDELFGTLKSVQTSQGKLHEDNVMLRNELTTAKEKISSLELKMQCTSNHSYSQVLLTSGSNPQLAKSQNLVRTAQNTTSRSLSHQQQISPSLSLTKSQRSDQNIENINAAGRTDLCVENCGVPIVPTPALGPGAALQGVRAEQSGAVQQRGSQDVLNVQDARSGADAEGGPWIVQGGRRRGLTSRNAPKIGTKQQVGTVSMVRPKDPVLKTSALFATRFAPEVTTQAIQQMIESSITLSRLKVSKIQTKRQELYSSFHIEVLAADFEKIDDISIWPEGCMIKPFYGRLLPSIVINDDLSLNG